MNCIIAHIKKPFEPVNSKGSNVNIAEEVGSQPTNIITRSECQKQPLSIRIDYRYTTGGR